MSYFARRASPPVIALACCLLVLSACGTTHTVAFYSPDRSESVTVEFPAIVESGKFEVALISQGAKHELLSLEKEVMLKFVQVAWVTEPKVVVVYMEIEPPIRLAFDRTTYSHLPFEPFREAIRQSIKKEYALPNATDPFEWLATDDSGKQFLQRYPAADLGPF